MKAATTDTRKAISIKILKIFPCRKGEPPKAGLVIKASRDKIPKFLRDFSIGKALIKVLSSDLNPDDRADMGE